ncbi:hypothetical protein N0V94_006615 [Neodidymelliopsis sp. IMI 364377]|nr:hypothetical protein N0V94_006615 [Neodidymelliopsis sp. IMI 364377]
MSFSRHRASQHTYEVLKRLKPSVKRSFAATISSDGDEDNDDDEDDDERGRTSKEEQKDSHVRGMNEDEVDVASKDHHYEDRHHKDHHHEDHHENHHQDKDSAAGPEATPSLSPPPPPSGSPHPLLTNVLEGKLTPSHDTSPTTRIWGVREMCILKFPISTLVWIVGNTGVELASFIHFINTNKLPDAEGLRIGQIPKSQVFQYPPTVSDQTLWNAGKVSKTKPSNHPRYLLPTMAYLLAKEHRLEGCIDALQVYVRRLQDPAQRPAPARTYTTCVIEDGIVYAVYSTANHSAAHVIGVKNRAQIQGTTFFAFLNNFPEGTPSEGSIFAPEKMNLLRPADSENVAMYKTTFKHTREAWITFEHAKELVLEFGVLGDLQDLWDMGEDNEDALPYKTHHRISCGHCSRLLKREAKWSNTPFQGLIDNMYARKPDTGLDKTHKLKSPDIAYNKPRDLFKERLSNPLNLRHFERANNSTNSVIPEDSQRSIPKLPKIVSS